MNLWTTDGKEESSRITEWRTTTPNINQNEKKLSFLLR
jgi:hypothetical protein